MHHTRTVLISMLCGSALAAAAAGPAPAKPTTPKLKLFTTKVVTTQVPELGSGGEFFQRSQLVEAPCGIRYQPLALGIASASHPLAAQDLGFAGMSVYASGARGTAKTKLQALCVRGGRAPSYLGREVKLAATGAGTTVRATLSCRSGQVALGAALAHGHAPAFGAYRSMPDGARRWSYQAQIPSSIAGQFAERAGLLGYPRVACVRAKRVSTTTFEGSVTPSEPAQGTATCRSGRALGWGVDLAASRSSAGRDGAWAIPTIESARFTSSRSMSFRFSRSGESTGLTTATPVRAIVVCGTLPRG